MQVELPEEPTLGRMSPSASVDFEVRMDEWRKKCNAAILDVIPQGYFLKSCVVKKETIVRHFADITLEKQ